MTATKPKQNRVHTEKPINFKEWKRRKKRQKRKKMSTGKRIRLEAHNSRQNSANVPVPFVSLKF